VLDLFAKCAAKPDALTNFCTTKPAAPRLFMHGGGNTEHFGSLYIKIYTHPRKCNPSPLNICGGRKPSSDEGGGFLRSKKTEGERKYCPLLVSQKLYLSLSLAIARQLPRQREPGKINPEL